VAWVRLGSHEFKKKGVSRFDLRDPYHLAVALSWPQFSAALLALYLSVNVVFATLLWLVPGSVANARPDSFTDAFFFSIRGRTFPSFHSTGRACMCWTTGARCKGYDAARAIEANAQLFVMLEARDPTLATVVHAIRSYGPEDIRLGMRYTDVVTLAADGTPVADLTRIGALEPDVGDRQEPGWTELEKVE
jgi:hypothetical protein